MNEIQEKSKGGKENYSDSLEYLRAKYLKKGKVDSAELFPANTVNDSPADGAQDDIEALKKKYSHRRFAFGADKYSTVCNALLLCAVIIVSLCSVIWFAVPVTQLGYDVYSGGTSDIFSFLFGSENSMYNQIASGIESIKNIDTDPADGIGSVMKLVRAVILSGCACFTLILIIIEIISALVYFFKGKNDKLISVSVKSVINKLTVYVVFVFFGSVSGGVGIDSYYLGYKVGTGMTVGIFLSLAILIAVFISKLFSKNNAVKPTDRQQLMRYVIAGAVYTAIAVTVTFMRLYSVFMYALTSSMTAVGGLAVQGFKLKALVFPALNLLLFVACRLIVSKVTAGFKASYEYMISTGQSLNNADNAKRKRHAEKAQLKTLILIAGASFVSCLAVLALKIPQIGFGWSADIFQYLVAIFVLSSSGAVFNAIIFKNVKVKAETNREI